MGTTLTAAYSMGIDLFIIHLGDSRVYLHRGGVLRQLTKDHTVAQAMADAGYIPPDQVRRHVKRNALTNFLGGHNGKVKADLRWLRLADGDRLLLCSDGLNEMVNDVSIGRILARHDARAAAQDLLDEALRRGGKDNVTIVVARYQVTGHEPDGPALRPPSATTGSTPRPTRSRRRRGMRKSEAATVRLGACSRRVGSPFVRWVQPHRSPGRSVGGSHPFGRASLAFPRELQAFSHRGLRRPQDGSAGQGPSRYRQPLHPRRR